MADEEAVEVSPGRKPAHPRTVLAWIVVIIVVAAVLHGIAPRILPVRVVEGPCVQMPSQHGVTLVWYTSKPATCRVKLVTDDGDRTFAAVADGTRHRVRLDELDPSRSYAYTVLAGERALTRDLAFQTNRPAGAAFSFTVFGDSGRGSKAQYNVAAEMTHFQPPADLLVHTGDVVYGDGSRDKYSARFFTPYRHLLARVGFWPCLGNHDIDGEGHTLGYQEVFDLPQNGPAGLAEDFNYWFDYGAARFVVLDTNTYMTTERLRDQVAPWLRDVLGSDGPRWKFVVCHHPPYTGGKYPPDERVQQALVPVFEETGVDVVFSGHDHNYQRTLCLRGGEVVPDGAGIVYVISGNGGAGLYEPQGARPAYVAAMDYLRHGFTHVAVTADELRLRHIVVGGEVIDEAVIGKPPRDARAAAVEDAVDAANDVAE